MSEIPCYLCGEVLEFDRLIRHLHNHPDTDVLTLVRGEQKRRRKATRGAEQVDAGAPQAAREAPDGE